jgi:catechol 2,3-dioxygenase-like lactoylglutathione lyase family enzyme
MRDGCGFLPSANSVGHRSDWSFPHDFAVDRDVASDRRFPHLLQTVLDTPTPRQLSEFYRELLGLEYRAGDAPRVHEFEPDWLVLVDGNGSRRLAFQLAPDMPTPRWPSGTPPQMLHLDLTVDSVAALTEQRDRAIALGAEVLMDKSTDPDEPLYVFGDPSGHPFCIFVVAPDESGQNAACGINDQASAEAPQEASRW